MPFARDSQSHYDYPAIVAATVLSSAATGAATAYTILKALDSQYPARHFKGLAELAFYKSTGFHQLQADLYTSFLSNHAWEMSAVWGSAAVVAVSTGYFVFKAVFKPIDSDKHIGGRQLRIGSEANREARRAQAKAIRAGGGTGLQIHPFLTLSRAQEVQSFLFMAAQGGGKTQVLWRLVNGAVGRADKNNKYMGDKSIIFDLVKGDFTESVGKSPNGASPVLISPWDARSRVWDIGTDCTTLADAESFARGLIPMTSEPLWATASRALLVSILVKCQSENGKNWGWTELASLCYLPLSDLKDVAAQYYPPALAAVIDAESKTSQSIYINLHTFLSVIYRLSLLWGNSENKRFSFVSWLNNDDSRIRTIILQGNLVDGDLSSAYVRAVTEMLTNRIASLDFKQSKSRRIWFFMDEVLQCGKLDSLSKLMEYGRSKGIATVLAIQDVSMLKQIYPKHEDQKWLALCGIKIYGQIRGGDSQKFVTEQVGTRIVDHFNQSVNRSTSNDERTVNSNYTRDAQASVIHESELEELGLTDEDGGGIQALVIGVGKNALKLQWPFYSPPKLREPFVNSLIIIEPKTDEVAVTISVSAQTLTQDDQQSAEEIILEAIEVQQKAEILWTELADEIADQIADTFGINSTLLDIGSELVLTENIKGLNQHATTFEQPITTVSISSIQPQKRKKAVRTYADET